MASTYGEPLTKLFDLQMHFFSRTCRRSVYHCINRRRSVQHRLTQESARAHTHILCSPKNALLKLMDLSDTPLLVDERIWNCAISGGAQIKWTSPAYVMEAAEEGTPSPSSSSHCLPEVAKVKSATMEESHNVVPPDFIRRLKVWCQSK